MRRRRRRRCGGTVVEVTAAAQFGDQADLGAEADQDRRQEVPVLAHLGGEVVPRARRSPDHGNVEDRQTGGGEQRQRMLVAAKRRRSVTRRGGSWSRRPTGRDPTAVTRPARPVAVGHDDDTGSDAVE